MMNENDHFNNQNFFNFFILENGLIDKISLSVGKHLAKSIIKYKKEVVVYAK